MYELAIFFIVGLVFGSFLNVIITRFPKFEGLVLGRSKCPKCKKILSFYDLLPVLSYIFLLGKCRYCKERISLQYPIVELSSGLLFVLSYYLFGISLLSFLYLLIFMLLIIVFVYDLKHLEIPELFSWIFLVLAITVGFYNGLYHLESFLLGGLVGGGILGILVGISDEKWMGSGDIKIGLGLGFLLGFPNSLLFVILSFVFGAIIGILILAFGRGKLKTQLPFAPFLIISAIFCLIYGEKIINFYQNFVIL